MLNFKQQFFPSIFLKSWSTVHYSYHNHCFKTHPVKLAQGYNRVGCKKKVQTIIDYSRSGQKLSYNSLTIFYNKNNVILIYKKKMRVDPGWPGDPSLGSTQDDLVIRASGRVNHQAKFITDMQIDLKKNLNGWLLG